jgi:dTMP kinase
MDISSEEAAKRGGFGNERYEATPFQLLVRERFLELMNDDNKIDANLWKVINAVGSIDEIHEKLLQMSFDLMKDIQTQSIPLKTLWKGDLYSPKNAPSPLH